MKLTADEMLFLSQLLSDRAVMEWVAVQSKAGKLDLTAAKRLIDRLSGATVAKPVASKINHIWEAVQSAGRE